MEKCETMGDKLGGITVRIGSRVAVPTKAGEVWMSRVKTLSPGPGLSFQD
jgi:hypothetical protein